MATVFLVGGTGNHLFQFTRAQPRDSFSYAFLKGPVHRLLGWTQHPRLFDFPKANGLAQALAMLILLVDLPLAKAIGKTLFSRVDLRAVKAQPLIARLVQIGYFQKSDPTRPIDELRAQIDGWAEGRKTVQVAMHIRGGDILAYQAKGSNPYGILPPDYYARALKSVGADQKITVFTDDKARAGELLASAVGDDYMLTINDGSLDEMIASCAGAQHFIACNSTLSYWILQLRGPGRPSISPEPFTKTLEIALPDYVTGLPVSFD